MANPTIGVTVPMKAECEHGLDTRLPCGDCQKAYEAENAPSLDTVESLVGHVDGTRYLRCLGWRFCPGNGEMCFDMCSEAQRDACEAEHDKRASMPNARGQAPSEAKRGEA